MIPTSKSHAQRAMCLAELLPLDTELRGLPDAGDVAALAAALHRLRQELAGDPAAGWQGAPITLAENGTALRILSVLIPMLGAEARIDAGDRLRQRPLDAAEEFLGRYGGRITRTWPRRCDGRGVAWPAELQVDARLTTQVATGVLLGAAIRTARGHTTAPQVIRITAPAAADYLFVTLDILTGFGFEVPSWWDGPDLLVEVQGWQRPAEPHTVTIPIDPSSYTFYAAFLAMHGLPVPAPDTGTDPHPDWLVIDDLQRLLAAAPDSELSFGEIGRRPDTFPALAALAALRCGRTTFHGAPALRHKESDRIHAMAEALGRLGATCTELPDGLTVVGPLPVGGRPVAVPTPDDHRIVMAAALLGTRIPGGVELDNPGAVAKSWPDYFEWLARVSEVTWL